MYQIKNHPILDIPKEDYHEFSFNGLKIKGQKGKSIASALHQAGFPVHSHSLKNRERSLECGIGKCGACEMLVDGNIRRICITNVDNVSIVKEIPKSYTPNPKEVIFNAPTKVYKTTVAIIGAGPAGLAAREELNKYNIENIVVDNNSQIGGQFVMQTHQFFFFEKEQKFGGMRGFDIAKTLAGYNHNGIFLNTTVWDILDGNRIACKNLINDEVYYIESKILVIATGAVPFMPAFENDDLPGVYTAAVIQKMMNNEFTLLGKNILTIGAGNIGYLTSYQLMQAGAKVKAIIEAQDKEGGFPVQANRVRRLGIPIILSHILIKALPNERNDGIIGAVIAESSNFQPIAGTEKVINRIDAINICTGLVPDDQLFIKGKEIFGRNCFSIGDSQRIGEGTSAVLRGKQVAYEILEAINERYNYDYYLEISKEYIDSQQHPIKVINDVYKPQDSRRNKPYVLIDCLYGFACNPCQFACKHGAITKISTSDVPQIDFQKCTGCMDCVYQCPGLAIFGYNETKEWVFLPVEYFVEQNTDVYLVDNYGNILGEGIIDKILNKSNKTNIARVKVNKIESSFNEIRGFIPKSDYPEKIELEDYSGEIRSEYFVCHCDDVSLNEILETIGDRKFISIDEVKHTTRLGMGACRGKRCIRRLKNVIRNYGVQIVGEATPRGPMSNQLLLGDIYPNPFGEKIIFNLNKIVPKKITVKTLIAGGGIAGSALFRYFAEAGMKPVLVNYDRGSSWRNIAGGRPAFSLSEIADIARNNHEIFKSLQTLKDINYKQIRYVSFAHNESVYNALKESISWSNAYLVDKKDFQKEISPYFNPNLDTYSAALITNDCWQATPGKVIDLIRRIGIYNGGEIAEDSQLLDLRKENNEYIALVENHNKEIIEYHSEIFVNAIGQNGNQFAQKLGIESKLFPVKHQAFITRRLPMLGKDGEPLHMLIDRRNYKGFVAVYGQQLAETGQIIGCASPAIEELETDKNLKTNSSNFLNIVSEIFSNWVPQLSSAGFQAVWSGYYIEPRMIIDTELGLFLGLRGQGYMLGQYLAKLYVEQIVGNTVPDYFNRLKLNGDGLLEKAFK